jgi:hypothetical protein
MLSEFQRYWNIARLIAILAGGTIYTISCHAHGFAPMLDVKGPSKEGLQQKDRDRKESNEREWKKYQERLREEVRNHYDENGDRIHNGESEEIDVDHSQIIDYERDNLA